MQNIEHDIIKYDQYFITKNYKKNSLNEYLAYIEKVLNHGVKLVQFRSKNLSKNQYSIVSAEIYKLCKKYKSFFIINNIDNLEFNKFCDGIQLTSNNLKSTNINSIDNKYFEEAKKLLPDNNYIGFSITQGNEYRKKKLVN